MGVGSILLVLILFDSLKKYNILPGLLLHLDDPAGHISISISASSPVYSKYTIGIWFFMYYDYNIKKSNVVP